MPVTLKVTGISVVLTNFHRAIEHPLFYQGFSLAYDLETAFAADIR